MSSTGMILDGIFSAETIDSSGEVVSIEGMDVSSLDTDGVVNYEHQNEENKGFGQEIVGKIVYVKKIFSKDDCENKRQEFYWNKVKVPYLYGIARLHDGAGHEGAKALAAIIRDSVANDEEINVRWSIEGSTIERDGQEITRSIARKVAATIKPCNKACNSGLLEDPNAPPGFEKKPESLPEDTVSKFEIPGQTRIGGSQEIECNPWIQDEKELEVSDLDKAMTASGGNVAPNALASGPALAREEIMGTEKLKEWKKQALAAYRDYDKYEHGDFKGFLKHRLPDASDDFINRFVDLADEIRLKKAVSNLDNLSINKIGALSVELKSLARLFKNEIEKLEKDQEPTQQSMGFPKQFKPQAFDVKDLGQGTLDQIKYNSGMKRPKNEFPSDPEVYEYKGKKVLPGHIEGIKNGPLHGKKFKLVGENDDYHFVTPIEENPEEDYDENGNKVDPNFGWNYFKLRKLPKYQEGRSYEVKKQITPYKYKPVSISKEHGNKKLNVHPEQEELLEGINVNQSNPAPKNAEHGINSQKSFWTKNARGKNVYVKDHSAGFDSGEKFAGPEKETAYYRMAKDFFGLGHYVPTTATFTNPKTGQRMSATEAVPEFKHFNPEDPEQIKTIEHLGNTGELHKLAIMNTILHNTDRHAGNYIFSGDKKGPPIRLIDHGYTHNEKAHGGFPDYFHQYANILEQDPKHIEISPEASEWLHKLKPDKFVELAQNMGYPKKTAQNMANTLVRIKKLHEEYGGSETMGELLNAVKKRNDTYDFNDPAMDKGEVMDKYLPPEIGEHAKLAVQHSVNAYGPKVTNAVKQVTNKVKSVIGNKGKENGP